MVLKVLINTIAKPCVIRLNGMYHPLYKWRGARNAELLGWRKVFRIEVESFYFITRVDYPKQIDLGGKEFSMLAA